MPRTPVGAREAKKRATETALRIAAIRLFGERGYDATSTIDIANEANVTPRTFFNHFPTKEAVLLLPYELLAGTVATALRGRPAGEDPAKSAAAAALQTWSTIAAITAHEPQRGVMLDTLQLMFSDSAARAIFLERRAVIEDVAWATLQERGVSADDLAARTALITVIALAYHSLRLWADSDGAESLVALLARCLLNAPDPNRLAAGITDTGDPSAP